MHHGHLARMDAQQAAKAHVTRVGSGTGEALEVLDVGKDAVQRCCQPGQSRLQQQRIACLVKHALGAGAAIGQAEIEAQVQRAEGQPLDTLGVGNFRQIGQPAGTFDDWPDRLAAAGRRCNLHRAFDLWQQHAGDAGMTGTERQVRGLLGMGWRVDAHQQARRRVGSEEGIEVAPRLCLKVLRDRILEVDDDRVGAARQRLGNAFRAGRRDEQRATDNR